MNQILRQPQRECHESPKDEEIIKRETPDLNVLQRFQLHQRTGRLFPLAATLNQNRIVIRSEIEDERHDDHRRRPDFRDRMPAEGDHDHWREEFRHRRTDIARTKNAERNALLFRRIPARDISNTNGERPTSHTDAECCDQHLRIGGGVG